jgi:DNA-binding GntR family transcriptional regulator
MSRVSGIGELVRLMILSGELAPSERVIEVRLADQFGIGRAMLREALRRLEGDGLLVADDGGGMHVVRVGPAELEATLQVRAALEALSAELAAARVADGDAAPAALAELERLAAAADDARASGPPPAAAVVADRHFHRAVDALGGNHQAREALNRVWDRIVLATIHAGDGFDGPGHGELLAAILAGDAEEAAARARRHAQLTKRIVSG